MMEEVPVDLTDNGSRKYLEDLPEYKQNSVISSENIPSTLRYKNTQTIHTVE
jgi:hypothetical protein